MGNNIFIFFLRTAASLPSLVLNNIKDCQSILEEVVSADRTKIIIRWQNFQIKFTIPTDQLVHSGKCHIDFTCPKL
jgi:hypothetical protein